jgi:class 3 adenylate cyclase
VAHRVLAALDDPVDAEPLGDVALKGFRRPVPVFSVVRLRR